MTRTLAFQLQLVQGDRVAHTHRVVRHSVQIGRLPANDLVINDPMVSKHHAVVWRDGDTLQVRDLGSRNGTLLNGERLQGTATVNPGDRIQLGPDTVLMVQAEEVAGSHAPAPIYLLEDLASGVCVPIGSDRFPIRPAEEGEEPATLLVFENGEVWVGHGTEDRPLEVDEPFEVAGRKLCLREGDALAGATASPVSERYPYALVATLDGATGPEATLRDQRADRVHRVLAANRAILLYLLARKWASDNESGLKGSDLGWVADSEVLTGIWGRGARDENKLHVLVYRLRSEVKGAGFDPWFVEKRRRYIRARLLDARVE
ncbi:MAG: FHA domain-containing protein [Deltaproteobacteria bacterium]|nr:FHA domain-containing protein [Deltaproteobacteria bacterium]